jgi:hypothetical protein
VQAAIFVVLAIASVTNLAGTMEEVVREGQWVAHWTKIGKTLAKTVPSRASIALCPIGAISYYSRLPVLDMLGLTHPEVARAALDRRYFYPGHQRHDASAILDQEPQLIMLANGPVARSLLDTFPWDAVRVYERDIVDEPRFVAEYTRVMLPLEPGMLLQLFARREFVADCPSRLLTPRCIGMSGP